MYASKAQLYGGVGAISLDASFARRQRQRMNLVAVCQCLFVPWITFCLVYAATGFYLHYSRPFICWLIVGFFAVMALALGGGAYASIKSKLRQDSSHEPTWFTFLFVTMGIAVSLGAVLGNMTFWNFTQKYYDYSALNDYSGVNVAETRGTQLMDGARVNFIPGTTLDLTKSMGFKNLNTYCVAPMTVTNKDNTRTELANYDFWAVGLDCCSGDMTDFHCGEYNNPKAKGGLRLLADDERSFYRLAVQQAEALYHVKATHPLFFYWTEDPVKEMESWIEEGYKYFFLAMIIHFGWQLLAVTLGIVGFSKMASN